MLRALTLFFLCSLPALGHAAENDAPKKLFFKITVDADGNMQMTGMPPARIQGLTYFEYARETNGNEIKLFEISSHLKIRQNGDLVRHSRMDRDGLHFYEVLVERTRLTKNMLPSMQASYYKKFDTSFCTVTVDAEKRETARAFSQDETHQPPNHNSADSYQLFHPAFPAAATWEQPASVMEAKGTLRYRKDGPVANGLQTVKVEGLLINPNKQMGELPLGKESFDGSGELFYDVALKQYVAGSLSFKTACNYEAKGEGFKADMTGTMKLSMERLAADPKKK